jgi:diguanylate cyclase (GGDEF)-like protein
MVPPLPHVRSQDLAWKAILAAGAVIIAGYFLLEGPVAEDFTYNGIGVASVAAIVIGVRKYRPAAWLGWLLLAAANACFVFGDAVYDVYDMILHAEVPFPSVADGLYLAGYPFLFAAAFLISRVRVTQESRETWADALIVCVGGVALSWQLLMRSYAHDNTINWFGRFVTMSYPMMDIGVIFIVAGALLSGAARRTSDQLIIASMAATLVGDFAYDILVLRDEYSMGNPVDAAFLISYVLFAAAALHPSMAEPAQVRRRDAAEAHRWIPLVAIAGFVSPTILLLSAPLDFDVDVPVLATTSIVLFALVVLRFAWLHGRTRQQARLLAQRGQSLQAALEAQRSLQEELRHQAFHDTLTGLPNRALLQDRIGHALAGTQRSGGTVAVFFCDLDGFKAVNDSLGHQAGDHLLALVANRLRGILRIGDTVARLGGDEFAVLLDDVESAEVATALAARIVAVLREPVSMGAQQIKLSVSVGVAFGDHTVDTEQILSEADTAMYEAKASGKDKFSLFEPRMRSRLLDRIAITNSFDGALARDEFHLEYQPQISLADGSLEGFEALVRWRHPTLGPLGPYRFISLAEDTGFIVELGRWILRTACDEAARWAQMSETPLSLAVNISARQLESDSLVGDVQDALAESGLAPGRLVLEITESILMVDPQRTAHVLSRLRAMGIRVAIDDFGTGYSSLGYLHQFPVDVLKIDKSFVDPLAEPGEEGAAFVQMILRLARDLCVTTVAEGVESGVQRDALAKLNCHSAQGYLISRPLSVAAARAFIDEQPAAPVRKPA